MEGYRSCIGEQFGNRVYPRGGWLSIETYPSLLASSLGERGAILGVVCTKGGIS